MADELKDLDAQCTALWRKLEAIKAQGGDGNAEYMATLYELRDLSARRLKVAGIKIVEPRKEG